MAADSHAADTRFRALLAADEAARVPDAQAREWAAFERKNPGVAHPGRIQARLTHGRQDRSADWVQGTARFARPTGSIAEQARAARQRQQRPVSVPDPGTWDDPMEEATMTEGDVFRSGYRHASSYR